MTDTILIDGKEINVETVKNDWAMALMTKGVIAKLTISKWGGFSKLTPEIIGLKFSDGEAYEFFKNYLSLGRQRLFPPSIMKELSRIETHARNNLKDYSFETVWGRFIPYTAFPSWEKENSELEKHFRAQVDLIVAKYDDIKQSVGTDYRKQAQDVWKRLYGGDSEPTELYIESYVAKILDKIPPVERLAKLFDYRVDFLEIPMPSFVEKDIALAKKIMYESELEKHNLEVEKQVKEKIAEQYVSKKKEMIDGFLDVTVNYLRQYTGEICDGVLKSLFRSKMSDTLTVANINKIQSMIKKVKMLNFYNDEEVYGIFRELEKEVDKLKFSKGEMNDEFVIEKLKQISELSQKEFVPNFNPSISLPGKKPPSFREGMNCLIQTYSNY